MGSVRNIPGVMFNSFPTARLQTFPRTLGGNPCHHSSRTLRVARLMYGSREKEGKKTSHILHILCSKITGQFTSKITYYLPNQCSKISVDAKAPLKSPKHLAPRKHISCCSVMTSHYITATKTDFLTTQKGKIRYVGPQFPEEKQAMLASFTQ